MSDKPDLVTFLTARYDEIEAAAEAYLDTYDTTDPRWRGWQVADGELVDPWRVLADIATKRRILAACPTDPDGYDNQVSFGDWESCSDSCPATILEHVLLLHAAPFAQHPDYDPAWAVTLS